MPNGISYNSYVIMDEKIAIMDTVDKRKQTEFLENLETALAGRTPDYLVISHMEPDHASSIQAVVEPGNHTGRQCEDISDAETVL